MENIVSFLKLLLIVFVIAFLIMTAYTLRPIKKGTVRIEETYDGDYIVQQWNCTSVGCVWEEQEVTRNFEEAMKLKKELEMKNIGKNIKRRHY